MEKQERRIKERKTTRKDGYVFVGMVTYVLSLIFRIPLIHLIGEEGVGYFGIVYELYVIIGYFFSYGLTEATASLVRYRVKREQYKNAGRVLREAIIIAGITGAMLSLGLSVLGSFLAEKVIGMPLCTLAINMMAPAVFFYIMSGAFKGFFQGKGTKIPAIHSKILETVVMIAGGLAGAGLFRDYGEKVSNLLLNDSYSAVYGAMGACVGILAASVFCFLHMLVLFFIYRESVKKQESQDVQRYQEQGTHIAYILFRTMLSQGAFGMMFHCLPFVGGFLFIRLSAKSNAAVLLGKYYGKYMVVIYTIGVLFSAAGVGAVRKIVYRYDREDYRMAKENLKSLLHQTVIWTVPCAVFTAVLSDNLLMVLFQGNNGDVAEWIMCGSVGIVFYVLAMLFSHMMIRLRKIKYLICYGSASLVIYCVLAGVLLKNRQVGIMALVIGNIVFYAILAVAGFLIVSGTFQYSQEWIRSVAFPVISAGIAGVIVMLLNKAFTSLVGDAISMILCLPVGIMTYVILLLAIRGVNEKELGNMFLGRMLIRIGKTLHLM